MSGTIGPRLCIRVIGSTPGRSVEMPRDQVRSRLDDDRVGQRGLPAGGVASRIAGAHGDELGPPDDRLVGRDRCAAAQVLDQDVGQLELLVGIQHVGQAVGVEAHPAEHPGAGHERFEAHHGQRGDELWLVDLLGDAFEDEA